LLLYTVSIDASNTTSSPSLVFGATADLHFHTVGGTTQYVDDMVNHYMNNLNLRNQWGSQMNFVFDLGDFCGPMSIGNLSSWKNSWLHNLNLPIFAVPGNHDVRYDAVNPYITPICMNESGNPAFPSYAFMKNNILFIIIGDWDGHMTTHPIQRQWVEHLLRLYKAHTTVICQHQSWGATAYSSKVYHHVHDGDWWFNIFSNNPQIKLCLNGHNHDRDYVRTNSSPWINNNANWGHDILFIQPSTFGSDWGENKHNSAIINITGSAIQFRWWNAQQNAWDGTPYVWDTATSYDSSANDWFSFCRLLQDGETYRQSNQWIAENITLQLIGSEPINFFENQDFHWCIDRKDKAWQSIGNDTTLAGNWDNANYASCLRINNESPVTLDFPNLNTEYNSAETTVPQSSVPKAIPGETYHLTLTMRTPNAALNNAFTMTLKCADKSTGNIQSILTESEEILLNSVSTTPTWQTWHINYTVPNNPYAWFLRGELSFLLNESYEVRYFSIQRQRTSDITESYNLTVSGHQYEGGNLIPEETINLSISPENLTDQNGDIVFSASIGGNKVGWFRVIFNDPLFSRNCKFSITDADETITTIILRGNTSLWPHNFKLFPFSSQTLINSSDGQVYTGTNGNTWLEFSASLYHYLTIMHSHAAGIIPDADFDYTIKDNQINFTDISSDSDGQIVNWTWFFDDGSKSHQQHPSHYYSSGGNYTVTLIVRDNNGTTDMIYSMVSLELKPPITNCTFFPASPDGQQDWHLSNVAVSLSATDDSSVSATYYKIDEEDWQVYTEPFTISTEGNHTFYYHSVDCLNNSETVSSTLIAIDKSMPSVQASIRPTEPDGWRNWYISNVTITFTANDTVSFLQHIEYNINETGWQTCQNDTSISFNKTNITTIRYTAVDNAGNKASMQSLEIRIDQQPPTTTVYQKPVNNNLMITFNATDENSGINATMVSIDNDDWNRYQNPFLITKNESHNISYYAIDNASNPETIHTLILIRPEASFDYTPQIPILNEQVNFTDISSDPDGTIINWTWNFGNGVEAYTQHPSYSYAEYGTYNVSLVVEDNNNMTHRFTIPILINSVPSAKFSWRPSNPKTITTIVFDAQNATDVDGTIKNYQWDWNDDGIFDTTSANPLTNHNWTDNGEYHVILNVTDNWGDSNTTRLKVQISNREPSVYCTCPAYIYLPGEAIAFTSDCYDLDGNISSYYWDFGDGSSANVSHPQHTYETSGNYIVTLTIEDDDGAVNSSTIPLCINTPPISSFTYLPERPTDISPINFTDTSFDSDGVITSYFWQFGDRNTSYQQSPFHQYADNGTYTVTLTIEDDDKATDSVSQMITVENIRPSANFTVIPTNPSIVGSLLNFTDNSTDCDGFITNCTWHFGDGNISFGFKTNHSYQKSGIYNVTVTVSDNDGATNNYTTSIIIKNKKTGIPAFDFITFLIAILSIIWFKRKHYH